MVAQLALLWPLIRACSYNWQPPLCAAVVAAVVVVLPAAAVVVVVAVVACEARDSFCEGHAVRRVIVSVLGLLVSTVCVVLCYVDFQFK
jgi:hypothetical protein